jgi:predicted small secreted protein
MRKFLILAVAGVALLTAACNTVSGAGKDVTSVGKTVTHTADDAK